MYSLKLLYAVFFGTSQNTLYGKRKKLTGCCCACTCMCCTCEGGCVTNCAGAGAGWGVGGLSKATEGFGVAGGAAVDSVGVAGVTGDVTFAGAAITKSVESNQS